MESKPNSYEKEALELYSELYLMNEGRVVGLGEPKSSAFKKNGSVYKACFGIYNHINTLRTNPEKEFWLSKAGDIESLQKLLWEARNDTDVLTNIEQGNAGYDFLKEYCDYYKYKIENFFIETISFQENYEVPSKEDKNKWN